MSDLWKRVADFFKEWDGEDMTKSMPLYVDDLREINSNRIDLISLEREHKKNRDKAIEEFYEMIEEHMKIVGTTYLEDIKEIAERLKEVNNG